MPFAYTEDGKIVEPDGDLLIDNVVLLSSRVPEMPPEFVRKLVQDELSHSSLDVVAPALINSNISHNGLVRATDLSPDIEKIFATSPAEICTKLVSCDAVLFGKVTDWGRGYYAIQSINSVGIELKLVSAKTGKVLFESLAEDSESRGLSKGPTGFSDLVIEPIKGLDSSIITELAKATVKKALAPLRSANRPEFLESSPPGIFALAHDASHGTVPRKGYLTIVALGTPGNAAFFSIGNLIENIPMVERGKGHYIGEFHPLPTDSFEESSVSVSLVDQFGRATTQQVGTGSVTLSR